MPFKKYGSITNLVLLISIFLAVPHLTFAFEETFCQSSAQHHRLALVIGNSAYQGRNYIKQPVNDAKDLAKVLCQLDFEVIIKTNLTKKRMNTVVNDFARRLREDKGIGLFYFSGHGLQENRENYLMAIDAKQWFQETKVSDILDKLKKTGNQANIVILDACRETPNRTKYGWLNSNKLIGLQRPPAVSSTLIAYAAKPGESALNCVMWDCSDRNSPYVKHLMEWIQKPNLSINEVLRKVRVAVKGETNGRQSPGYYDELDDAFYFKVEMPQPEPPRDNFIAGKIFRDSLQDESLGPEMVWIPAGSFQMGDIQGEGDLGKVYNYEKPVHSVSVARFAMGKYEVTFAEYDKFAQATNRKKPNDWGWGRINNPVIMVSWKDATAYVAWLSQEAKKTYRLPTEAEWEYAARAGTITSRYWGNNPDEACRYANLYDNSLKKENGFKKKFNWKHHNCRDGYAKTAPVGSFKPNAFGLFDMLGNVGEWVADKWHSNYNDAPTDGSVWNDNTIGYKVLRGGSWNKNPHSSRAASRDGITPDAQGNHIGFRVVRVMQIQ
jgi:formylglycine-generating enzyme required for sulfatase activity